ncbi:type II secretion system F family protein [Streptomyces boninensis]|uniref:type II secretion system F family protein n=1 Tax=Streptomyces boninensis TaxID=2039455 RepID=UPI003B222656
MVARLPSWPVAGVVACALAASWFGWLGWREGPAVRRCREMFGDARAAGAGTPVAWVLRWAGALRRRPELWCLPGGVLLGLAADSLLPVIAAGPAAWLVGRRIRARRSAAEEDRRAAAVIDLCGAVVGGLRAGRQPGAALVAAVRGDVAGGGLRTEVLAAARFGGDVPAALRRAAAVPGAGGLRGVAACWQVATDGGAGLADGLERVAGALRAERRQRDELRAQLAGPRSTAVLLALLPVFGLVLGSAMGAAPLRVLLHTPYGLGCLAVGGALEWAGLAWTGRIVRGGDRDVGRG